MAEDERRDLLMELYNFIKDGNLENDLLVRDKKLSILSTHLFSLNKVFATYNSNEILDSARREAVEFLRDFCFRLPSLKLVHTQVSVPGAIDVSRLHSLTHLEIGKAPVHLLTGLRALRQQLQVLICTRCLHSVEILVGKCGGDMAEEQDWPRLQTLNLSFNYLTNLDASLQFLPSLRVLDLSHNQIQNTGTHLECLPELQHLNLSYNCLSRAPSLGQVSHRKLKSLSLRHNDLHYLDGIHLYENLEFLDLSRNCIYEEQTLHSLNYVWQICRIFLIGNPITFEPLYRQMVTKNLPPATAFREVYLDGRPLSEAEVKMIPTQRRSVFHSYPTGGDEPATAVSRAIQSNDLSIDSFEDSGDYSSSGPARQLRVKGKRKKKTKVRRVVFSEAAQKEELPSITPKSFENSHLEEAKREFERKRDELGSDWLLALQEPYKQPAELVSSKNPFVDPKRETGNSEMSKAPSKLPKRDGGGQDTIADPKSDRPNDKVVVIADVEIANGHHKDQDSVDKREPEKLHGHHAADIETREDEGIEEKSVKEVAEAETAPVEASENGLDSQIIDSEFTKQAGDKAGIPGISPEISYPTGNSEALPLRGDEDEEAEELHRCSSEEDLCGPLLVKVPHGDSFTELFLTVKQTHLEESNINGDIQERLELKSLLSVDVSDKQLVDEGLVPVVSLNFDYVRKDRRARNYYMEDQSSAENLAGVLENFWQENQQKTVTQYMSCLKCAKEFPLSKAVMIVDRPKGRKSSDHHDNALNEVPTCPHCGNRYLVEGEQSAARNNNGSSIVGSLTSSTKPLATSSPWKPKENGQESTSLGLSSRFLTDSPPSSKPFVFHDPAPSQDETPNDSMTSETLDVSLKLPESTIPPDSLDAKTPIEEVAHYSRDQLDNLLKTDESDFRRKYSLVQEVSVDGSINRTPSIASQQDGFPPVVRGTSVSGGTNPPTPGMIYATGRKESDKEADEDIYGGGRSDEDEFDILDDPGESRRISQVDEGVPQPNLQAAQKARGVILAKTITRDARHDSNESDIAVLSDRERHDSDDPKGWMEGSSTSGDNVFGSTDIDSSAYHSKKDVSKSGSEREEEDGSGFQSSGERRCTADSGINGSASGLGKGNKKEWKVSLLGNIQENYRVADHRLKLFYSMSLFSSDDEEFQGHISGSICANSMLGYVSYEGLIVVSTSQLYVLKVVKEESDKAADFLNKKFQSSLNELLYIHIGLGSQLIQFEFTSEGGGRFTLLIGDKFNVENFMKLLEDSILRMELHKFEGIQKHEASSKNILVDLLDIGDELEDWSQMFYVHGLDPKSKDSSYIRRGILLTAQFIYLVEENCSWPLMGDKSSGKVPARGQHYTLKGHFSITDITDVDCNLRELKVFINFSDEDEEQEEQWELKMLTASSMRQLLNAINKPWSEQFGVDLTVSYVGIESTCT